MDTSNKVAIAETVKEKNSKQHVIEIEVYNLQVVVEDLVYFVDNLGGNDLPPKPMLGNSNICPAEDFSSFLTNLPVKLVSFRNEICNSTNKLREIING